jgi:hypothetical protein
VTITGNGIKRAGRSPARAGTYAVRVNLSPGERKALERRHRLRLKLRAAYAPPGGRAATVSFTITVMLGGAR